MTLSEEGMSFVWRNPWVGTWFSGYYTKDLDSGKFVTVLTPISEVEYEKMVGSSPPPWESPFKIPPEEEIGNPREVALTSFLDPTTGTEWVVRQFLNPENLKVWSVLINND